MKNMCILLLKAGIDCGHVTQVIADLVLKVHDLTGSGLRSKMETRKICNGTLQYMYCPNVRNTLFFHLTYRTSNAKFRYGTRPKWS